MLKANETKTSEMALGDVVGSEEFIKFGYELKKSNIEDIVLYKQLLISFRRHTCDFSEVFIEI